MDITTVNTLVSNVSKCEITTYLTINESRYSKAYTEPLVDYGGTFDYTNHLDDADTFTLPTRLVKLSTGTPASQSFDGNVDVEAPFKLTGWRTAMVTRLTNSKTTLMANDDPNSPNTTTVTV